MDLFSQTANHSEPTVRDRIDADVRKAGGPIDLEAICPGAVGFTMFDVPGSEDQTLTVLLPEPMLHRAPSQSLLRVRSGDGKSYLAMVTAGPFAEPDSLRGDSGVMVASLARGGQFKPPYHGRVQVSVLGEELGKGILGPPRLRPLPHSPVVPITEAESAEVLKVSGDIRLGTAFGLKEVVVGIPSDRKEVLPRHTAVLGTTGGGKSTTIAGLIDQAQKAGMAVVLLDVEGEYTRLHQPTTNAAMRSGLGERGLTPRGLPLASMRVLHLVGREPANPEHPMLEAFSLRFERLSPYAAMEILGLTEAQEQRFLKAYDIAKEVLRDLGIFPASKDAEQERQASELDEFEEGYPKLTLSLFMDVVAACLKMAERDSKSKDAPVDLAPFNSSLKSPAGKAALLKRIMSEKIDNQISWRALLGRISRLLRVRVFDVPGAPGVEYASLLKPGAVNVIDLSDSGMTELNSIVIADMLTGIQSAQDDLYAAYEKAKKTGDSVGPIPRTLIVIEEAHEFLSEDRIDKMRILFQQVAKIAKRGRKRWLGLVFVTQLPQHLPRQVLGLVNSFVLHKISDPQVIASLRKTISGIDEGLWNRLPALAPGQAIASFPHMTRPLLISVDPAPGELRMAE